jgi:hypothetical protein
MSHRRKFAVEIVLVHLVDVGFEVEARNDLVGGEECADRVIEGFAAGDEL